MLRNARVRFVRQAMCTATSSTRWLGFLVLVASGGRDYRIPGGILQMKNASEMVPSCTGTYVLECGSRDQQDSWNETGNNGFAVGCWRLLVDPLFVLRAENWVAMMKTCC